jgi:hypothetical protein
MKSVSLDQLIRAGRQMRFLFSSHGTVVDCRIVSPILIYSYQQVVEP